MNSRTRKSPGAETGAQMKKLFPTGSTAERQLQLTWCSVRMLADLCDKLDDLLTLAQQQNDLLRRMLERPPNKCNFGKENQPEPTSAKSVFNKHTNQKGK